MAEPFLHSIGIGYLFCVAMLFFLSVWLPKRRPAKILTAGVVAAFASIPLISGLRGTAEHQRVAKVAVDRFQLAASRFAAKCKDAGNKIPQVQDGVEGVLLTKLRPRIGVGQESDPMWPGAALAQELPEEEFIRSFLAEVWDIGFVDPVTRTFLRFDKPQLRPRFEFVEVVDRADSKRYRYAMSYEPLDPAAEAPWLRKSALVRKAVDSPPPRYAVDYEDHADPEDRQYWIAGTIIRVLDLVAQETIAEKTVYVMDGGQGSRAGSRSPWLSAGSGSYRCPSLKAGEGTSTVTRDFVFQVLKPRNGG